MAFKYYVATAHDKPSLVANTCTHRKEFSFDLSKVNECKTKTSITDCAAISYCNWITKPKKFRKNVKCGTFVSGAADPILPNNPTDPITLEECNLFCLGTQANRGCNQFLWNGDSSDPTSKGMCETLKNGCTFDQDHQLFDPK